jgi:hypothetical protein
MKDIKFVNTKLRNTYKLNETHHCIICLTEIDPSEAIELNCGHIYDLPCVKNYFTQKINDRQIGKD